MPDSEVTLRLPADDVQIILNALAEQPFRLVAGTITAIMEQAVLQVTEQLAAEKTP